MKQSSLVVKWMWCALQFSTLIFVLPKYSLLQNMYCIYFKIVYIIVLVLNSLDMKQQKKNVFRWNVPKATQLLLLHSNITGWNTSTVAIVVMYTQWYHEEVAWIGLVTMARTAIGRYLYQCWVFVCVCVRVCEREREWVSEWVSVSVSAYVYIYRYT